MLELFLDTVAVAEPGPNEVLIRVEATPVSPSDLGLILAGADVTAASAAGTPQRPVIAAPIPDAAMRGTARGSVGADGASAFVNPMTAPGMIETMRLEDHAALVHTGAASNLGQLLNRLCQEEQVPLVNIVRRPEQEELLRAAGAAFVCDSSKPEFMNELTAEAIEGDQPRPA